MQDAISETPDPKVKKVLEMASQSKSSKILHYANSQNLHYANTVLPDSSKGDKVYIVS